MVRRSALPLALALAFALVTASSAQPDRPLGTVAFLNSGAPRAQADFLRGVAWLHSFGYEEAIDAFRAAQRLDPSFALAYWGEAMCFNQPLWFQEEPARGRAALAKLGGTPEARIAKARTPREQGYMKAIEALWGPGDKRARDQAYRNAMAALAKAHPDDDEAQVFHALSILAMLPRGDAALPMREQAGAIAEGVFRKNPKHPGAAHYILHAYDHGRLAARALPAARTYAKIAPAASHALHMPAHAFVQLGLWEEAASTDMASWAASVDWQQARGLSIALRDFHSLAWLEYEWTQLGQFTNARRAIAAVQEALKTVKPDERIGGHHYADSEIGRGTGPLALRNDLGSMRARYIIETERWGELKGQSSFDNIDDLFAVGMSAVKLGDMARARSAIDMFRKATAPEQDAGLREQAAIMLKEMEALVAFREGRHTEAFAAMDQATALQARMPKPIGRPYPVKGADELYGELLLEAGRASAAVSWFERTLSRTPLRSRALLGLARAHAKAGNRAASQRAYKQLLNNWKNADPDLPELKEARAGAQ